jgi:hypothetical protein
VALVAELRVGSGRRMIEIAAIPIIVVAISLPAISDTDGTEPTLPYPAQRRFADDGWAKVRGIVAQYAAGKSTMWLSQYNDGSSLALAYTGTRLVAPTMSLWMVPAFYETHQTRDGAVVFHAPDAMSVDEKWLWAAVSDAFVTASPPVLVDVKNDPGLAPDHFDYVAYFSMNPKFRAHLATYRIAYEDAGVRVYVRNPGAALVAAAR